MSTEIKNTLFRFVSMRAPELSDETKQNEKFIFRNENIPLGVFDAVADKTSKWQELQVIANDFIPLTLKEIKALDEKLTKLSVWIAKNRLSYKKEDLIKYTEGVEAINDTKILGKLWDNLFYQTVTQKDFYAKETLIQLLIANNFLLKNEKDNLELAKKLLNAKVVLPKSLFIEENNHTTISSNKMAFSQNKVTKFYPEGEMQKQQIIAQNELQNEKLQNLGKELKTIEKVFKKEYNDALTLAEKDHQKRIKPILDQYKKDLDEAKQNWCEIKDPSIEYNPNDPCNQPPTIPTPDIPEFEFTFRDELDIKELEAKLTKESFETLLELTGHYTVSEDNLAQKIIEPSITSLSNDYNSLQDITNYVTGTINTNNEVIISNTTPTENTLVSIGGMLLPIVVPSPTTLFGYQLCSKRVAKGLLNLTSVGYNSDLSINVPDSTWNVANFNYTLERTDGNYSNNCLNSYLVTRVGNTLFLKNINIGLPKLTDEPQLISFSGKITFTNGVEKTFVIPEFKLSQCSSGQLNTVIVDGDDPEVVVIPGAVNGNESAFIPSGFGVKQLGIADYKKVEQTTQCYVEGDVAHIENIMAREYKEKSTRRLRRSENTSTTSSETEKEHLTDSSTTSRFDMQSEVAKVIQESRDFSAGASFSASWGSVVGPKFGLGANANYATHNSKEESTRQAVTQAKEITESALDRIVSKVKEERIEKIIEEFEENNKHGFDNTKGDKHVVGVFRWVDKLYKNQIINYGKRLMFEFMIPQPAKLHILAMSENQQQNSTIIEPTDPRKATTNKLDDFSKINDTTLKFWASKFNVEINPMPEEYIYTGKSLSGDHTGSISHIEYFSLKDEVKINEGYKSIEASVQFNAIDDADNRNAKGASVKVGNQIFSDTSKYYFMQHNSTKTIQNFTDAVPVSATFSNYFTGSVNISVKCQLTNGAKQKWQQEAFKAIIDAYEDALVEYNDKIATEKATAIEIKGTNPGFYREFENKILRKNCISYLIDQNPSAKNTYGKSNLFKIMGSDTIPRFGNTEVNVSQELDDYAAFVKFMEQAFEWEIMSYNLYPYYWGNRTDWASLYQYDDSNDPLFRNFMQAGMARVVVTVRPGFEDAVRYYMQTGQIWNGGEVPLIDDELFVSIVDELSEQDSKPEGKAWITRIPTALTILQADSIGLKVEKALPCNCDDVNEDTFENPEEVPCNTNFEITGSQLSGGTAEELIEKVEKIETRMIENVDIENGYLKLTTDTSPRQVVAQISVEAIKQAMQ
jgi:hypothetical protein